MEDIPASPPKSLISRYLSISQEKGNSPLLDIAYPENPILFLYQKDSLGKKGVSQRVLNTLSYHSIPLSKKTTIVLMGEKHPDNLEEILGATIPSVQVFHWSSLMIPIQDHMLVPKHTPVKNTDVDSILKQYTIFSVYQLPAIQVNDPMAKFLFLKIGDLVHIDRNGTNAYRVCVPPITS